MKKSNRTVAAAGVAVCAAVLIGHGATAQGAVDPTDPGNRFTFGEFMTTSSGQAKGNVEGQFGCGCSGDVIRTWTGSDGADRKQLLYPDTTDNSAYVTYVLTNGTTWRTASRMWGTDGEGYVVPWS